MKILRAWLSEFVDLDSVKDEDTLAVLFSRAGIEVASRAKLDNDTLFEVEITANRPDLLSHRGVAREIAALAELPAKAPAAGADLSSHGTYPIQILSGLCRRYCGVVMRGVTVADSPAWIADRVRAMELKPISNVVDATNYALFEANHPLHAFDLDKLDGEIQVRHARPGEKIALLDGTDRLLNAEDLVIADSSRAVALAGIMGGSETAVTAETKNLLLEAAWFDPSTVRRTARRLGISTDSSYRFERGADVEGTIPALKLLVSLIQNAAGGAVDGGVHDVRHVPLQARFCTMRAARIREMLGHEVRDWEAKLHSIGVTVSSGQAILPSWRPDLVREIDLIEELARLDGYDRIGVTLPAQRGRTSDFHHVHEDATLYAEMKKLIADYFATQGFDRCVNFSFEEPAHGDVEIRNPMNVQESMMRGSLLPSLRRTAMLRADRSGAESSSLFEIDKIFRQGATSPEEHEAVAFLVCGLAEERRYDGRPADAVTLDHLIGLARGLGAMLRLEPIFQLTGADSLFNEKFNAAIYSDSAMLVFNGRPCGRAGELRSKEPGRKSYGCEIDLYELHALVVDLSPPRYTPLPRFPASSRDLAFWISVETPVGSLVEAARSADVEPLESCALFDIFTAKAAAGTAPRKSVAIRLVFRASDRTLTEEEVNAGMKRIIERVCSRCGGELRAS